MSDECKFIDPTAFGLFVVAIISLPLAISGIGGYIGWDYSFDNIGGLLLIAGILLLITAGYAYKAGSNFGFVVFGLVSFGVFMSGVGLDAWSNIAFGLIYLFCLVWSLRAHTLKNLTLILLTTALIFIAGGLGGLGMGDWTVLLGGIAALGNFLLCLYLAYALADENLPCF